MSYGWKDWKVMDHGIGEAEARTVVMLIEAARRAEAAVKEMLAVANDGTATTAELRDALGISKSIVGVASAFQTSAAAAVAGRERHGDGGAEVLAAGAGLSRRDAHSQVKTAEALRELPAVRDAVESGRVSAANAKRLADAAEKAGARAVDGDEELLAKAESMRPEQFGREARRWVTDHDDDGGKAEHARQRARRSVRVWDGDDGMVHLHGEFDTVTGKQIADRLRAEARRMYDADKKNAGGRGGQGRSFNQCMADALDNLTANNPSGGGKAFADICVVAHLDADTGTLVAETPEGDRLPEAVLEMLACNSKLTGLLPRLDIATAYFNLGGYMLLADSLDRSGLARSGVAGDYVAVEEHVSQGGASLCQLDGVGGHVSSDQAGHCPCGVVGGVAGDHRDRRRERRRGDLQGGLALGRSAVGTAGAPHRHVVGRLHQSRRGRHQRS